MIEKKTYKDNMKNLKERVISVIELLRGHFTIDMTALIILPQVFAFRLIEMAKKDELPRKYSQLDLKDFEINHIYDICDLLVHLNESKIVELNGSMQSLLYDFETLAGEDLSDTIFDRLSLNDFSIEYLDEVHFGKFFSSLMNHILSENVHKGGALSSELIENIYSNIKFPPGNYKVLDPTFGIGNSAIKFVQNQRKGVEIKLYGYEVDLTTYSYAVMNLLSNGIYSFNIKHSNALNLEWDTEFDLIFADPPISFNNRNVGYPSQVMRIIEKSLKHLNNNGRACFLVSNRDIANQGKVKDLRANWIREGLLRKVISLPDHLGKIDSSISINILIFENSKGFKSVEFVDLTSKDVIEKLKLKERPSIVFSGVILNKSISETVSHNKIIDNHYNLLPIRYVGSIHHQVESIINSGKGLRLREVLTPVSSVKASAVDKSDLSNKYIKSVNLKDDPFLYSISVDDINTSHENLEKERYLYKVSNSCLLISRTGNKIKPTYINIFNGEEILVDNSVGCFKLIPNKIRVDYLIHQLHSDIVKKQFGVYAKGSPFPQYLSKEDFLNIVIKLPDSNNVNFNEAQFEFLEREQQKLYLRLYEESKTEAENLKQKLSNLKKEESIKQDSEEEELIEFLNHTVRNNLSLSTDSIDLLYNHISKNDGEVLNLTDPVGMPLTGESVKDLETIDELFEMAKKGLNNALRNLKGLEDFRIDEYKPDNFITVNIFEWLKNWQESISKKKPYKITVTTVDIDKKELMTVKLVENSFSNLLDNFINNAEKHGFTGKIEKHSMVFEVTFRDQYVTIDYMNDGEPLKPGMSQEKFIARGGKAGDKSGNGFGGFLIHRIIRKHDGIFEIMPEPTNSNWSVHFRISLPLINSFEKYDG